MAGKRSPHNWPIREDNQPFRMEISFQRDSTAELLCYLWCWSPAWQNDLVGNRRHFQMHFYEWKVLYFDSHFTEVFSQGSIWQYSSIVADNGLVSIRRQAIFWTNGDPVHRCIYTALGRGSFSSVGWWYLCNGFYTTIVMINFDMRYNNVRYAFL